MRDFSDALFEDMIGYGSSLDWDFWYDLFDKDASAAMYAAREIVYSLVGDAETAQKLSEWGADLEPDEQIALDSLIADALEGANEHEAMMDYCHNKGLELTISDQVGAKNKKLIDKKLANASDDDKHQILSTAINSLVLNGYMYEGLKGNTKENKLTETSGMPVRQKKDINEVQKEIREYISKHMYQSAASDIFEYGIIDAYGNEWVNFNWNRISAKVKNSDITLAQVFNDHPEFKALVEANTGKLVLETVAASNMAQNNITIHLHVGIFNALTTKSQALADVNNSLKAKAAPEQPKPVTEAVATAMTQDDIGDFFYEDFAAAMYVAREITYDLVSDEESADALLAKAEDWEDDEYLALESLIVDALEGANEHYAAMHYAHNVGLAINISDRIDSHGKAIANKILKDTTLDKVSILFLAVNALVVNGYLY